MNKKLSLIGNGSANTIINGSFTGSGITINADYCNVSGFKIIHCGHSSTDAGIKIDSHYNSIEGNTIQNYNTNGIALNNSTNNIIENNILTNNKRGIYVFNSHYNQISGNTISNNSIFNIMLVYANNNLINKNIIENCFRSIHLWICDYAFK